MTGSLAIVFFASVMSVAAQIASVSVQGPTATQAVLRFTAPDNGACTVDVSESAALTPLVHDVDPVLFPASNLDSRAGNVSTGRERVFVIGKRRAEKAVNTKWYSRALQAYTPHYYRITCGAAQATGSFFTSNIALGNTYNEDLPADPNAGTAGYFINSGQYAWPEFTNWDNNTGRRESLIDPHTGMLLKRITMPQDQPSGNQPAGDHFFQSAIDFDSAWTAPGNVLADDGVSASFSGPGSNWLFLRGAPIDFGSYSLETMTFSMKAWCSGSTCSGDNAKTQVCLTINGVSCWPNSNMLQEQSLSTTPNPDGFTVAGSATPLMTGWTPPGYQPLNLDDVRGRSGLVNVDASGNVTWTIAGDWFNPNWTAGSRITIAGVECTIANFTNSLNLTIDPASCPLSLPRTGVPYSAINFGVMIRKKTASLDRINVQFARYTWTASNNIIWPSSGSPQICSDTLTQNTVTGALGYHCIINGSLPMVYWIDRATGDANYLGFWTTGSKGDPDGWNNGGCGNASITLTGTGPTDPERFYCNVSDRAGKEIILGCSMTSTNQPGDLSTSCRNLTPSSGNKDLINLIAQFTAGQVPSYDPTKFTGCGISGMQNEQLIMACNRGNQDTVSWTVVFDPRKIDTAAGCASGGIPGCVIAASPTWTTYPARWCGNHTLFSIGNTNTVWQAGKFLADTNPSPGGMAQTSLIISGTLGSSGAVTPGSGACPPGALMCDVVTVDGEPCNVHPQAGEGNNGTCAKDNSQEGLQDAAVGDVFYVMPARAELVQLVAKSGNSWTLQRGYANSTPISYTGPIRLAEQCLALTFGPSINAAWLWDFRADPHGLNASGIAKRKVPYDYDHPTPRQNVVVGDNGNYAIGSSLDANPILFSPLGPAFAGVTGETPFGEAAQPHASRSQDTAPDSEQNWFLDARPLSSPTPQAIDMATVVSGQLYKFTSSTVDGDTLRFIGGGNAEIGGIDRKKQPTLAYCGAQPLTDISSAAMGNTISDTSTSAYQYCISRRPNECRTGSAQGDVYVNCPYAKPRPAIDGPHIARPAGTYGCWQPIGELSLINDICLYNTGAYLNAVAQMGYQYNDPSGALGRSLTKGLIRYKLNDKNQNVRTLPDGSWLLFLATALSGTSTQVVAGKMPPYPPIDSVNRQTFIPLALELKPPGALGVDNAIVQFGYAENGPTDQHYCTTRREACIAANTAVPDPPFQFASEGAGGTAAGLIGVPCSNGCSVALPALPQRIVYYQVLYRDSANRVVGQSPLQVTPAP